MATLPKAFADMLAREDEAQEEGAPNPMGVSESESDEMHMKGSAPNPLKRWATAKVEGKL